MTRAITPQPDLERAARLATAYTGDELPGRIWRPKAPLPATHAAASDWHPSPMVFALACAVGSVIGLLAGAWIPLP
jgi:hypothetical protein